MISSILASFVFSFHAYYLSFTEMEYNKASRNIEVSIKLTAHDLKKEMNGIYNTEINFEIQSTQNDSLITLYLKDKFTIQQKGKKLNLELDGFEYDLSGDLFVFCHFEKFNPKKSFEISNRILFQYFPNQQNIVHFKVGDKKYQKTMIISSDHLVSDEL